MHAAAAESGGLADRVHARHRRRRRPAAPGRQVGLQPTEGLAGQDVQPDGDQRTARAGPPARRSAAGRASRAAVRSASALSPRYFRAAAVATTCGSLPSPVRTCRSRASISLPQRLGVDQVLTDQLVHLGGELGRRCRRSGSRHPASRKACTSGVVRPQPAGQQAQVLAGEVAVLLRAGQPELLAPSSRRRARTRSSRSRWRVTCRSAPSASKPGNSGAGKPLTAGVEPQRRRPRQDADAVVGPHRGVVDDALGVVPHPVRVDHPAAGPLGRPSIIEPST